MPNKKQTPKLKFNSQLLFDLRKKRNQTRLNVIRDLYRDQNVSISPVTLQYYEQGLTTHPSFLVVAALCDYFKIDMNKMLVNSAI